MGKIVDININTDGLAKLGETISQAFGLTAYGNKKIADANSYAAIKAAETENKVALIKKEGEYEVANYVLQKESRKLENTKSVVEKAQQYFTEGEEVSSEPVNQDWISRFINTIEDITDSELQDLWARILAGEVKQPNSYSLRTLDVLKNLSKDEALTFTKSNDYVLNDMLITQFENLSIDNCTILADAGLITFESLNITYSLEKDKSFNLIINKNNCIIINNVSEDKKFELKFYKLSKAGLELSKLIDSDKFELIELLGKYIKDKTNMEVTLHKIENCNGNEYSYLIQPIKTF